MRRRRARRPSSPRSPRRPAAPLGPAAARRRPTATWPTRRSSRNGSATTYGIDAELLPPPAGVDRTRRAAARSRAARPASSCASPASWPTRTWTPSSRPSPTCTDERLVVVGEGPEGAAAGGDRPCRTSASRGASATTSLRWLYANCRALVAASYEDFGLTPLEAAAFGRPAAALRWGGFLDTVVDGGPACSSTGPTPRSVAEGGGCWVAPGTPPRSRGTPRGSPRPASRIDCGRSSEVRRTPRRLPRGPHPARSGGAPREAPGRPPAGGGAPRRWRSLLGTTGVASAQNRPASGPASPRPAASPPAPPTPVPRRRRRPPRAAPLPAAPPAPAPPSAPVAPARHRTDRRAARGRATGRRADGPRRDGAAARDGRRRNRRRPRRARRHDHRRAAYGCGPHAPLR